MGKSQRLKGHGWERTVARDMTEAEGQLYERNLTETRGGPRNGIDVESSTGGRFAIQCKCSAAPVALRALEEARKGARPGEIPVAALHRTSGSKSTDQYVVIDYDVFLELVAELSPCFEGAGVA